MAEQEHPSRDEILALEKAYWNALLRKDGTEAARLAADPSIVTGRQGAVTVSRDKMKTLTEEGNWSLEGFEFEDVTVHSPTPDLAIIAYTVSQTVTMNGKTETRRAVDSSVWIRESTGWVCCAHNETFLS